ncbi:MAG TPA: VTT domain-containing protein [Thermoanaerobaculia bacterium]|nr:VTT domain-containing protein [Thermoanaerobaculia bacterium]
MALRRAMKAVIILIIAAAFLGLYFTPIRDHLTRDGIRVALSGVRDLWYGPLVFITAFAAGCVVGIPATLFVLAAGVIWGWKVGALYAIVGGLLGAAISYYIGAFLGEGVLRRFGRMGLAVERQVASASFRSFLILRLLPIFPFPVLNYGAGVARLPFRRFIAATSLSASVGALVFAYSADAIFNGTLTEKDAVIRLVTAAGLLVGIVLLPLLLQKMRPVPLDPEA